MESPRIMYVGTAGWTIPGDHADLFPADGTHLHRYARRFLCAEINSAFYRNHQRKTYERWAASVPEDFRFSVKLLREFTQTRRLRVPPGALREVVGDVMALGKKLGVLLVQLPPSLDFEPATATRFLGTLREIYPGPLAWEPRHPTWGGEHALRLLERHGVTKVRADPERCPGILEPEFRYLRLHGTPEIYRSRYPRTFLRKLACWLGPRDWCIFDNTALGYATLNALELQRALTEPKLGSSEASL